MHTLGVWCMQLLIRETRFSNAELTKVSGMQIGSWSMITGCNPTHPCAQKRCHRVRFVYVFLVNH